MKKLIFIIAVAATSIKLSAQEPAPLINRDSTEIDSLSADTTKRVVLGDKPEVKKNGDTTRIRLGKNAIVIVEKDGKTTVEIDKIDKESNNDDFYGDHKKNEEDHNDWNFEKKQHKFKPHFAGLELNLNNFVTSSNSMSLPTDAQFMELNTGKSIGVRLNFMEFGIPITPEMGFVTGLGLEFNSYYFSNDNNITKVNGQIISKPKQPGAGAYDKNKLKDTYLNIPLLYEIQFPLGNSKKPLYFSAGIIGGIKISSSTKEYYSINGEEKEDKVKDDFYLSPFRYGVQAKVGFRMIHLVGTYFFSPLFQEKKGPELYPFDIGLVVLNF